MVILLIDVQFNVIGVPERVDLVTLLAFSWGDDFYKEVDVLFDYNHKGGWWNSRRGWKNYKKNNTHVCLMEEDIVVCKDFKETVYKILELLPNEYITLFSSQKSLTDKAVDSNQHWVVGNRIGGSQCRIMPVWMIEEQMEYQNLYHDFSEEFKPYKNYADRIDHDYLEYHGKKIWVAVPNLVQHTGRRRSAFGMNAMHIKSKSFIGCNKSGLSVDWGIGICNPPEYNERSKYPHLREGTKVYDWFKERNGIESKKKYIEYRIKADKEFKEANNVQC